MATDLLTPIDEIIATALRDYAPLSDLVSPSLMQFRSKAIDIRGDVADLTGKRIKVDAPQSSITFLNSSSAAVMTRSYRIWIGTSSIAIGTLNQINTAIMGALCRLSDLQGPDGSPIVNPAPFQVEIIELFETDPEIEPQGDYDAPEGGKDNEEWTDVCTVRMRLRFSRAALVAAVEA